MYQKHYISLFQKGALDIMFYEDNDIDTWYNIVDNKTSYLLEGDELNPVYSKLSLKKIVASFVGQLTIIIETNQLKHHFLHTL